MSVLVKGMEKPEHCGYCRFRYDGICHALQKTQYSMDECPLAGIDDVPDICVGDTINRQAALKAVTWDTEAYMAVNMLPAAQQWIPCSDRLPEEGIEVLITTEGNQVYISEYEMIDGRPFWYDFFEYVTIREVIAWMPLPEPYKQEDKNR